MVRHEQRVPGGAQRLQRGRRRQWTGLATTVLAVAAVLPTATTATAAVPAVCNVAPNGSFEDPNIEGNPNSFT